MRTLKKAVIALIAGMAAFELFIGRVMVQQGSLQTSTTYVIVACLFSAAIMGVTLSYNYLRRAKKAAEEETRAEAEPIYDSQPAEEEQHGLKCLFVDATNEYLKVQGYDEVEWKTQGDGSLGAVIRVSSERADSYLQSFRCFEEALHSTAVPLGLKVLPEEIDRFAELFNTMNTYAWDGGFELNPDETEGQFVRYQIRYDTRAFAQPDRFGNGGCEMKACIESTGMTNREVRCMIHEPLHQWALWESAICALKSSADEYPQVLKDCTLQASEKDADHSAHYEEMKKMPDGLVDHFGLYLDGFGFRWAHTENGYVAEFKDGRAVMLQLEYKEQGLLITAYFRENGMRGISPEQERMLYRQLARYNMSLEAPLWCYYSREKGLAARHFFLYNCEEAHINLLVWKRSIYWPVEVLLDLTSGLSIPGLAKPDCAGIESAIRARTKRGADGGVGDTEFEAELWENVKDYYECFHATFDEARHECEFEERHGNEYACHWSIYIHRKELRVFCRLTAQDEAYKAPEYERMLTQVSQLNSIWPGTEFKVLEYKEGYFSVRHSTRFELGGFGVSAQPPTFGDVMWISKQVEERNEKLVSLYRLAKEGE